MQNESWDKLQASYLDKSSLEFLVGTVGCAICIYIVLLPSKLPFLQLWLSCMLFLSLCAYSLVKYTYQRVAREEWPAHRMKLAYLVSKGFLWLAWSYISLGVFPYAALQAQAFIALIIVGIAAASVPINFVSRSLTQCGLAAMLLPFSIGSYMAGCLFSHVLMGVTLVYLWILMRTSRLLNRTMKNEYELGEKNKYLLQLLEDKTTQIVSQAKRASLGEVAGSMAHEINNPLSVIVASIDLLKMRISETSIPPQMVDQITERMSRNIHRITDIIKGVRQFSSQNSPGTIVSVPLRRVVDEAVARCEADLQSVDAHVDIKSITPDLMIECCREQICTVLSSLIKNSCDAVQGQSQRWIVIEGRELPDAVEIRVQDSGGGIPEAYREKIMHPFFSTKPVGTGLGLGLPIAAGIVRSYGGTLRLDEFSHWTTFTFVLSKKFKVEQLEPSLHSKGLL